MGQYYRPITKDSAGNITTYNRFLDGCFTVAKLTEHSWWNNPFVCTIAKLILHNQMQIAWVGDYSDVNEFAKKNHLHEYAWSDEADEKAKSVHKDEITLDNRYLVNHSKKAYLDCNAYKKEVLTKISGYCILCRCLRLLEMAWAAEITMESMLRTLELGAGT